MALATAEVIGAMAQEPAVADGNVGCRPRNVDRQAWRQRFNQATDRSRGWR